MNRPDPEVGWKSTGASQEQFGQRETEGSFSVDQFSARWTPRATLKTFDEFCSNGTTPSATPKEAPTENPRATPSRQSVDGELPRRSVSSILGGISGIVVGRKSGRLCDEDELQGNTYYEEVIASRRTSNASPLASPVSMSMALPFQTADFDVGLASDVEVVRHFAMNQEAQERFEVDIDKLAVVDKVSLPICLTFVDVTYKVVLKPQATWRRQLAVEKEILHGITGSVAPGEILALMGPSGSGKTTLLNILGGRVLGNSNTLSGTITYNNQMYTKCLKSRLGFVTQDDIMYPHLTVRETLIYAALLRLPKNLTEQEKIERAEKVMEVLKLGKCRDTIIGNSLLRGVSGGERKRVCIGHEILIDPSLIFLDEPTSGLDSTTALHIIQLLQNIASQGGRTVVTTIHQPSSRLFHMFDKLILLAEGYSMYFGKARDAMNYFRSIGFSPLIPMNPAEFLLDLCGGNINDASMPFTLQKLAFGKKEEQSKMKENGIEGKVKEYLSESCEQKIISKERLRLTAGPGKHAALKATVTEKREWTTTWWQQFRVLLSRGFKERRHEYLSFLRIAQVVATSIICGLLWWKSKSDTSVELQDQAGLVFFFAVFWSFIPCTAAIFTFPLERAILAKERASNMYRLSSYFMSRTLSDLPLDLILPVVFVIIVYFMAHLRMTVAAFCYTILTVFLIVLTSQSLGLLIGAAVMDVKKATTLSSVLIVTFMLTGGFFLRNIAGFIRWMKYLSFHSYAYKLLIKVQYSPDQKFNCSSPGGCQAISSSQPIHGTTLGGGGEEVWALLIMILGYRILAYVALYRMKASM
eukprot:c24911_g1_i1 orf=624-3056(-)